MVDTTGPNQPITITLERWRWEQVLLCLDRYVSVLRGNDIVDDLADDAEWAKQLDAMTDEFRAIVSSGGNGDAPSMRTAEEAVSFDASLPPPNEPQKGGAWTATENAAVVEAYFWILDRVQHGREVNKAAKYRELEASVLPRRNVKSIERKMQNISAVLDARGLDWIEGLKPLANYQFDLGVAVEEALAARGTIDAKATGH